MRTLSVNYYFYILKILENMGLDRGEIAHIAPFELEGTRDQSVRIDIDVFTDLFRFAQSKFNDPHIGLHVSDDFRIANYGYAGSVFSMCDTLQHSIDMSTKYACLAHTLGKFRIPGEPCPETGLVTFVWSPSYGIAEDEKYRQITECVLSNYVLTLNWLSWSISKGIEKISFRHSSNGPELEYERALSCPVEFDAPQHSIVIHKDSLTLPLPTANPLKFKPLERKLSQQLSLYNAESNIVGRIKYVLHEMIEIKRPSLAAVAEDLSLSERTVKRYLKQENSKFQDILKSVKMERCETYLAAGYSYADIAQMLWYHDQSAFTRAYKQWYGVSPRQHANERSANERSAKAA